MTCKANVYSTFGRYHFSHDSPYHGKDVIMGAMEPQITGVRSFAQPFIQAQIKENTKAPRHWPLCGNFTGDRWSPRKQNGQWRGKCFHHDSMNNWYSSPDSAWLRNISSNNIQSIIFRSKRTQSHTNLYPCNIDENAQHSSTWWVFFTGIAANRHVMTSSNGNISRVTGPLCGEFTGHRRIYLKKASDMALWCFLCSVPE